MFLLDPILVRKQALHVLIRTELPPLIPLFLLREHFCRQRCRVRVLDVAFWLLILGLCRFDWLFDGGFFDGGRLLPFLADAWSLFQRVCEALRFQFLDALFEAVLVELRDGEDWYDVLGGVGFVALSFVNIFVGTYFRMLNVPLSRHRLTFL